MPCKCNNHMKNVGQLSIREGEKVHKPDIQEIKDIVAIKTFTEAKDEGERTTQMETAKEFFEENKTLVYVGAGILAYLLLFMRK